MRSCDVLIVGGGPAGSTCAWALRRQGMDVVVVDKAVFPRDKVCAGWITPAVVEELELDLADYGRGRVLQPIDSFETGRIGGKPVRVEYGRTVSYGIRRFEFDHYLLDRSGVEVALGHRVRTVQRRQDRWIVDDQFEAPLIVAAGGHFCPVARMLLGNVEDARPVVAAQEIEFELSADDRSTVTARGEMPQVYFCRDLQGYGWCFRKGNYLNVGLGRENGTGLASHLDELWRQLAAQRVVPRERQGRYHGHAYYLYGRSSRPPVGNAVLAIGDAAGLAYEQSGEGIRPAVESGLMAAEVIAAAAGDYSPARLEPYRRLLEQRFGRPEYRPPSLLDRRLAPLRGVAAALLLRNRLFVRRVLLDRWFFHAETPPWRRGCAAL